MLLLNNGLTSFLLYNKAAKVSNRNRDPTSGQKNNEGKQKHMPESHIKKSVNEESRIRVPVLGHKSSGTFPKPAAQTLPQNNPPKESTLQGGSLLSMVSSCPVDLTVAASEKVQFTVNSHYYGHPHDRDLVSIIARCPQGES